MSEAGKPECGDGTSNKTPSGNAIGELPIELVSLNLTVNGRVCPIRVEPRMTLLDVLREELALTGTKKARDRGPRRADTPVNTCGEDGRGARWSIWRTHDNRHIPIPLDAIRERHFGSPRSGLSRAQRDRDCAHGAVR